MKHGLNTDDENTCIPSVSHLCRYAGGHTRVRGFLPRRSVASCGLCGEYRTPDTKIPQESPHFT
jgi:hypothetical protein